MSCMTVVFADTNIVVYAYGADPIKIVPAKNILNASPVISTQVINEFHNVARRKLGLDMGTRHRVATDLLQSCRVIAIDQTIVVAAMQIEARYQVSYWDALIITAALVAGCDTLYSEDLQNGQVFESRLKTRFFTRPKLRPRESCENHEGALFFNQLIIWCSRQDSKHRPMDS